MTAQQHETTAAGPVRLYDEATGRLVAEITPRELRQLQDALEEEFPEDHDYYINADTLDYLAARGWMRMCWTHCTWRWARGKGSTCSGARERDELPDEIKAGQYPGLIRDRTA